MHRFQIRFKLVRVWVEAHSSLQGGRRSGAAVVCERGLIAEVCNKWQAVCQHVALSATERDPHRHGSARCQGLGRDKCPFLTYVVLPHRVRLPVVQA